MKRSVMISAAVLSAAVLCGAVLGIGSVVGAKEDGGNSVKVRLADAAGIERGTVSFTTGKDHTEVQLRIASTDAALARDAFHGLHIHANDNPANGEGCVADPDGSSNTWFTAVDGHWKDDGQLHPGHHGDLPPVLLTGDGSAELRFVTDRIELGALHGKAVIMHAGPDNFANIPVGTAANQYQPNSAEATTATRNTGNAGDRVLCGVIP